MKKPKRKKEIDLIPSEYQEQVAFVEWLEAKRLTFTAIPASTWTPGWNQKRRNYAMGVRKGCPDLLIIIPTKGLAFVEMKRLKSSPSRASLEQRQWIADLNSVPSVEARVCKGAVEAIAFIEELL